MHYQAHMDYRASYQRDPIYTDCTHVCILFIMSKLRVVEAKRESFQKSDFTLSTHSPAQAEETLTMVFSQLPPLQPS